ncbi:sugar transferase [Aldersonia sp. NBC_00410]|uniref:sugar transferase n=1 Tax=Aldersonia sp. NBC_00410 TaxID=2975954 RepID=UPI0022586995|nr:sugar transferase [Aldersonia sp. NBC_00410]MCX5042048.1 sugar transferase [Aldersonia sp. NBC_00410]
MISDLVVVCVAIAVAQFVRFGGTAKDETLVWAPSSPLGYTAVSAMLAVLWIGFLALFNTRSPRVIGAGAEEYRLIASATFRLFGVLAIISLMLRMDIARGYLAIAFPLGLVLLLLNRRAWRQYAVAQRARERYQTSVLVVGGSRAVPDMAQAFARDKGSGYHVVGVCTPEGPTATRESIEVHGEQIPIVGVDQEIVEAVRITGADTVALTATDHLRPDQIKRLVWSLDELGVDLIVTPGLVDIAGQRLRSRPVAQMPMLHIEKPQYDRAKSIYKQSFDFVFALGALLLILPVIVVFAVAVKFTSPGSVFYRSERMGLDGLPFQMIKFRSMYQDADKHKDALVAQNDGAGPLFKMREDPRVTPVGKFMRKFSIDELPQFINVLRGDMSVVGPRPPLRSEVEQYDGHVRRRMLVKPGVTGLWQISGRSDLSWEETVRLDLSYVENWSMMQDLLIIKRTLGVVSRSEGAY